MGRPGKNGPATNLDEALEPHELQEIRTTAQEWASLQVTAGTYPGLTLESLRYLFVATVLRENSPRKVAEVAGVDFKVFYRHHNKPEWKAAVASLVDDRAGERLARAIRTIERLMEADDPKVALAAARTELEMQGKFVRITERRDAAVSPEERARARKLKETRLAKRQEPTGEPRTLN